MPDAEIRNAAVSLVASASSPAASVTACHMLQFDGLNVRVAPLCTVKFALPAARATDNATSDEGRAFRRTKKRPSPASRTLTFAELKTGSKGGSATSNVRVLGDAAFQLPSPGCAAATPTVPVPVNARLDPSTTVAGPATTEYSTDNPLDAVAASATTFVASWLPTAGKSRLWLALSTCRVPMAFPWHWLARHTIAVTA